MKFTFYKINCVLIPHFSFFLITVKLLSCNFYIIDSDWHLMFNKLSMINTITFILPTLFLSDIHSTTKVFAFFGAVHP